MTVSTTSIVRPRRVERRLGGRVFRSPTAVISLLWLVGLLVASLTSPIWLRYGPLEQDLTAVLQGPSLAHFPEPTNWAAIFSRGSSRRPLPRFSSP